MTSRSGATDGSGTYRVLDAGCGGGGLDLDLPPHAEVIGLDSSPAALARNTTIDQALVGDLQTFPLESDSFDEILCWNVLEHIPRPERAFANLARSLKPGGKLTVGVPNVLSAKALITKFTPISFHVWVYRRFFPGLSHAGEPGYGPWKTYLRWSIRPNGLTALAAEHGLAVESSSVYEAPGFRRFLNDHQLIRMACRILFPVSDPSLTEYMMVARKPPDGERT